MAEQTLELEGTWEEILKHSAELAGKQVRVIVQPRVSTQGGDAEQGAAMLRALMMIDDLHRGIAPSDGTDTQQYLREARAGAMYGYPPCE